MTATITILQLWYKQIQSKKQAQYFLINGLRKSNKLFIEKFIGKKCVVFSKDQNFLKGLVTPEFF